MDKTSTRRTELFQLAISGSDEGLDQFHSYLALNHIIFKKAYPLNFIKISHISINLNGSKSGEMSEISINILGAEKGLG